MHTLKLWDIVTGDCLHTFKGYKNAVNSVSLSPNGKKAVSGDWNDIKLWDVATGNCLHTFEGHTHNVESLCFSPDGRMIISGSTDNSIKLWDVATGAKKCLATLEGHRGSVYSVCFSPNGKTAVSGSGDGTVKLWNVATLTKNCLLTFEGHKGNVYSVCFSPDGTKIVSGSEHEIIIISLDHFLSFPGWRDWDDGALPYIKIFLALHPNYTSADFGSLVTELQNHGYGWLRPQSLRAKLENLQANAEAHSDI